MKESLSLQLKHIYRIAKGHVGYNEKNMIDIENLAKLLEGKEIRTVDDLKNRLEGK